MLLMNKLSQYSMRLLCISGILLLFVYTANAQITINPTHITDCKKTDGKATVSVANAAAGLDLEYSVDGGAFQASGTFENLSAGGHTANVRDKNTQCSFSKGFTINEAPNQVKLTVSGFGTTEFCNNANPPTITLTAAATGGSGNYTFTPASTITVSSSGRHTFTVADNVTGCTQSLGGDVIFVPIICSRDPNDIVGPEGYDPGKMIAKSKQHSYMIRFENDPGFATAPAQIVKINHPLHNNVNPFTLRLGDFGFAGMTFTVPADKTFYSARLNLVDSLGVVVDVTAGVDAVKREAFWIFESKDPVTGLPPANAHLGFLPVNDSTAKGEGFVTYLIKAANHTQTGDSIYAKASIVFDANGAIETPLIYNTIDAVAPKSSVSALPVTSSNAAVTLKWKGSDDPGGSGIRDYSLYVSENGGVFKEYQAGIKDTLTTFSGNSGSTYGFYTIATDNTGNREDAKIVAEQTVAIDPVISRYIISGRIAHPMGSIIPNTTVRVSGDTSSSTLTNTSGTYNLTATGGFNYNVRPFKNNDLNKTNGVSTLDIAFIQSHILQNATLNSPYKIIAADVNNNGSVSSLDILYIRRLILGLDTTFPGNRLWAFVDSSYQFSNPSNPFPYKDSIRLTNLSSSKVNQSFIGVKLGDVTFDWNPGVFRTIQPNYKPIELYYNDINAGNNENIRIPLKIKNFKDILGMQFTLNFNKDVMLFKGVESNLLKVDYSSNRSADGKLTFLWNDVKNEVKTLEDGTVLMEIIFDKKAKIENEDIQITSDITSIEAWDKDYVKHNIIKGAGKITSTAVDLITVNKESWEVVPNPTTGVVKLLLSLTNNKTIQLELTNTEGKVLMQKRITGTKGKSNTTIDLSKPNKLAAGMYYLKATGINGGDVKKIIVQ